MSSRDKRNKHRTINTDLLVVGRQNRREEGKIAKKKETRKAEKKRKVAGQNVYRNRR